MHSLNKNIIYFIITVLIALIMVLLNINVESVVTNFLTIFHKNLAYISCVRDN